MNKQFDIVKGCIGKKNLLPILKHLRIRDGWITSTNGRMTILTPIEGMDGIDVIVPADKFMVAINRCDEPTLRVTKTGRLSITQGKYRALLPLLVDTPFPTPQTGGIQVTHGAILPSLKQAAPFMADDASRPWACGVLIKEGMTYSTNNTTICRAPVDWQGPSVNLPSFLVNELLRLKLEPLSISVTNNSITIELADNVWLNSTLLPIGGWPNTAPLFEGIDFDTLSIIPEGLEQGIIDILPFCPDPKFPSIQFTETGIQTDAGDREAGIDMDGLPISSWRAEPLLLLLSTGHTQSLCVDFTRWPSPCPWCMENGTQGLIMGLSKRG